MYTKGIYTRFFSRFLTAALLLVLSQKCGHLKQDDTIQNIYMTARTKPLALLCFSKEDLDKVIADPRELGFLANEGKCFLEEEPKKVKVTARLGSSDTNKVKSYAVYMQNLKQEAHVLSDQLIFTEIWQRVFVPKERLLFNCKTSKQCKKLVDKLEKGGERPKELARMQRTNSSRIPFQRRGSQEDSQEVFLGRLTPLQKQDKNEKHSAARSERPKPRLYPRFFAQPLFNWR